MRVLAIESTCDETGAAIVELADGQVKVISEALASSAQIHQQYGGVVPEVAAREQLKVIIPVLETALWEADLEGVELDAVAVAVGPGLIGSLLIGVETAKTLAFTWNKPIIPVNHLVAHVLANWIKTDERQPPQFPALAWVVSGGHTDLLYLQDINEWQWLAGTRDDAAGEYLDKSARILGLGYPGGPALEQAALKSNSKTKISPLPRPLIHEVTLDVSFSGLKSAVAQQVKANPEINRQLLAREVIEAMVDTLTAKTELALRQFPCRSLILAGGVAANQLLRDRLGLAAKHAGVEFYSPALKYCTDNSVMIGAAAVLRPQTQDPLKISAQPALEVV